jgi:hypothetical protein
VTPDRRLVALVAAVIAVAVAAALVAGTARPADRATETGVVIDVRATSLTEVQAFTIRTADGRTVTFRVGELENATAFPPGHLNEHRATAQPVVVTYLDEADGPRAIRIDDAG